MFLKCLCNEVEEVRCLAIRCLHCFWAASGPAMKFTPDECSGVADFLSDNSITLAVYQSLMDFALALKVGLESETHQ